MDECLLEERLAAIEKRNVRVESDKAWEVSAFRRLVIAMITYVIAAAVLTSADLQKPFLSALIPTVGYLLSTLSLPAIKQWWIEKK